MNTGFVKLHRKMTEWEWYDDANTFRLFFHFIIKANFKDKHWRGITVKRGSFITGYDKLSQELKLSKQQIRTSIAKLKSTGEITHQATNAYSVVTLINYDSYQDRDAIKAAQATPQTTVEQHSDNIPITPTKNVKNEKKEKKQDITIGDGEVELDIDVPIAEVVETISSVYTNTMKSPTKEQVDEFAQEESLNLTGFFNFFESNGWRIGMNPMESWRAAARGWRPSKFNKGKTSIHDLTNQNYQSGAF